MYALISYSFLVLVITTITLWIIWRKKHMNTFQRLGIPGPKPNLIFGNLADFQQYGNVKCLQKWRKEYGKIYGYWLGGKPWLVLCDTEILKNIQIKDFHSFINRPEIMKSSFTKTSQHMFRSKDNVWKDQRALLTPTFTTGKMKKMLPLMDKTIDILINKISKQSNSDQEFDISEFYKGLTMDVIGRTAFGIETNVQTNSEDPMLIAARTIFEAFNFGRIIIVLLICFPEFSLVLLPLTKLINYIKSYFGTNPMANLLEGCMVILKTRRENPETRREDLLQLMIDAELRSTDTDKISDDLLTAGNDMDESQDNANKNKSNRPNMSKRAVYRLSDDEVLSNIFLVLLAGYETSSTTLAYITYVLVTKPEIQEKVRLEIQNVLNEEGTLDYDSISKLKYMEQVISETLRHYPPISTIVTRETSEDMFYGDLHIPKDMAVQVPVPVLHRDESYWEEPDKFWPERFAPENRSLINQMAYQPFGVGPRNCVGMRFAQMEIKLTLAKILREYRLLPTDKTDKGDIEVAYRVSVMSPKNGVYVKAVKL